MAKTLFLAWSSPTSDETDAAFNDWYENTHIPQVRAAIPSITSVHRYRTADLPGGQQPKQRYLAVYELDTEDIPTAAAALGHAAEQGKIDFTDTIDLTDVPPAMHWYASAD
jgi:EthD domain